MEMKLEALVLPVSDVDRAKRFYGGLGWRLDADFRFDNGFRVIQFTPPGSECSVQFGAKLTSRRNTVSTSSLSDVLNSKRPAKPSFSVRNRIRTGAQLPIL